MRGTAAAIEEKFLYLRNGSFRQIEVIIMRDRVAQLISQEKRTADSGHFGTIDTAKKKIPLKVKIERDSWPKDGTYAHAVPLNTYLSRGI